MVDDGIVNGVKDPLWLSVPDAWAIESVSASGDTQVSIKIKKRKKDATLPGPGKNKITLDQIQVEAAGSVGDNIVVPSTGSGGRLWGSIHLRVDIQKAKRAGLYSGIEVEIKAENI